MTVEITHERMRIPYVSVWIPAPFVWPFDLTTKRAMRRVATSPVPGDYVLDDDGTFTFATADVGHMILLRDGRETVGAVLDDLEI